MKSNPETTQTKFWWREVYYLNFAAKQKKPWLTLAGDDQGIWLVQEAAAWVYELVRHSPRVRDDGLKLPGYEQWPPFPQLQPHHRVALTNVVEQALGFRPLVTIPPPPGATSKAGYSEQFPGYSWDLLADDKPLVDTFMCWIRQQREKSGFVKTKGKKGSAAHNRRELPKRIDWRWVEALEHRKGQGPALSDTMRRIRTDAQTYAYRFVVPVVDTIRLADEELRTVSEALLGAHPQAFGEVNSDNFNLDELKAVMGQFETILFGKPAIGIQPSASRKEITSASSRLDQIIESLRASL